MLRRHLGDCRWQETPIVHYSTTGRGNFKDVTRQNLFAGSDLTCQLRYFEVAPGGYSSLERHAHVHAVMIVRGRGRVLLGDRVEPVALYDLIDVPPYTWHQFQAADDEALGFLCLVNCERDRPQLPTAEELADLRRSPDVAAFIKGGTP